MALVVKDRVQETSTTTGTGSLTLLGAVTGFQTFSSAIGNTNTTYYTIQNGAEWEVGVGTVSAGALSRDTVLESSNGGSLVNFSAGSKFVFCTYPAEKSVYYDASNNVNIDITGNAATVTNGVYTSGDQTIGGNKTFSSTILGSISGNAATVTNGLYTTNIGSTVQAYDADTTKNDVANTFTANQVISVTDNSNAALRVTQLGTGDALVVEDSSNPDSTPFVVKNDGKVGIGVSSPSQALDINGLLAISGIATKQIIAVHYGADDADYTRTSTTNAVFGGTVTITPVSADSKFAVFATMTGNIDQTGTDNDATGLLTACSRNSNGSYTAGWTTLTNNIGIINGGTSPTVSSQICVFQTLDSSDNKYLGNVVVRHFGSIASDATSGYAATLNALNLSVLAVEYLG